MSGGVDSSVAAALLKEQGYDVIGVTMHIWSDEVRSSSLVARCSNPDAPGEGAASPPATSPSGRGCCGCQAVDDARRVAYRLGIPHYVMDFRREFEEQVIADFCAEYAQGRTPNPCIRCNKYLKFDLLVKRAQELDAGIVATGHYARCERQAASPSRWLLKRPRDRAKDQTYVLYFLKPSQLRHVLFPLGDLTKSQVRDHARDLGLLTADKPESQGICFAPRSTYPEFLLARFPELARPGPILDSAGSVIGTHKGIIHYTIGQRRRIGIARANPLYVIAIDPYTNTITVGPESEAYSKHMTLTDLNLVSILRRQPRLRAEVQIRYQHQPAPAEIRPTGHRGYSPRAAEITLDSPQWAVTPGQAAVLYDGDTVIGGGTIQNPK
jgi:tRNA-specific 2-thiouridylase